MDALPIALIATLTAIGLIHFAWGLGLNWPATDPISRAARVVGTPGRALIGFFGWTSIAVCFFAGAAVVWIAQTPIEHPLHAFIAYGGYLTLILVFALRGLAPYLTRVFDYARSTPFYTLNRRYYAPVCLLLAAGLVADFPAGIDRFILPA
jgi:hypothetical protein